MVRFCRAKYIDTIWGDVCFDIFDDRIEVYAVCDEEWKELHISYLFASWVSVGLT